MRDFMLWLIICFTIIVSFTVIVAHARYDTVKIDCGTLHGNGRVVINFGDELYIIPVSCK